MTSCNSTKTNILGFDSLCNTTRLSFRLPVSIKGKYTFGIVPLNKAEIRFNGGDLGLHKKVSKCIKIIYTYIFNTF